MKPSTHWRWILESSLLSLFLAGCSSVPKSYHDPEHIGYQEADHKFLVWLSPAFDLASPGTIHVAVPSATVVRPHDAVVLEETGARLQSLVVKALNSRLDPRTASQADASGAPVSADGLRLELTIVDYWEGDRATSLSLIPGSMGAGHPWILVRGKLLRSDTGEALFRFVAKRGYEGREAGDSWTGHEDPLAADVQDLALDLADLLERARDGRPLTKS